MKTKTYIFLFFLIISNFGFGQDSLVINSFSQIKPNLTQPKSIVYKNTYVLNKQEKDSIWSAVFSDDKTQDLLKRFPKSKELYLIENQINLFAVLNSGFIDSKTKRKLLKGKLKYDKKHLQNNEQSFGVCGLGTRPTIIEFSSKEKAIANLLDANNSNVNLFDSDKVFIMGVNYEKEQPIQAVVVWVKEQFKLKHIPKHSVLGVEVHTYPPFIQTQNALYIYYNKK